MIEIAINGVFGNILFAAGIVLAVAVLLGILILVVSHFFRMPVNKVKDDISEALPGANCGGCGFAGCDGYAEYLAEGGKDTSLCSVGGEECAREIASILGVEVKISEPKVAHLLCQGTKGATGHTHNRYEYRGTTTCSAANGLLSGPGSCTYGCLGFGDCVEVCAFRALSIQNGIVYVNESECTGCGACVNKCPKNLLQLFPISATVAVRCQNGWPGGQTRKNCSSGCIGCQKCVKACPVSAISMKGKYLAVIDQETCIHCGKCVEVCPIKCLVEI